MPPFAPMTSEEVKIRKEADARNLRWATYTTGIAFLLDQRQRRSLNLPLRLDEKDKKMIEFYRYFGGKDSSIVDPYVPGYRLDDHLLQLASIEKYLMPNLA